MLNPGFLAAVLLAAASAAHGQQLAAGYPKLILAPGGRRRPELDASHEAISCHKAAFQPAACRNSPAARCISLLAR
jgi:hypothetical protein